MEKLIIILISKYKFFLIGLITGWMLNLFEIQAWNIKWHWGKFLLSCLIFGFLTEFSFLLIEWNFIWEETIDNESRVIVLSILVATTLYLFIPFILKRENRGRFIEATLAKFWFIKENK